MIQAAGNQHSGQTGTSQPTLFDRRAEVTLRQAFDLYHKSKTHRPSTIKDYGSMLRHWERETANPLIGEIDNLAMRNFREALFKYISPRTGHPLGKTTVAKNLRYIQAILATCGPAQHGNPEGLDILQAIPVCGKPQVNQPPVVTASEDEVCAIYHYCQIAKWPRHAVDVERNCCVLFDDPSLWWRSLVVYLFNVGSRLGEFLTVRTDGIDLNRKRLLIDPEKQGSSDYKAIHPVLADHILQFWQPRRTYLFACPNNLTYLRETFYEIQRAAGIHVPRPVDSARKPYYGFHELRKTCGTSLAAISEAAAQHQLGHKSINTTRKHYVSGSRILERVSDQIQQPAAFYDPQPTENPPPTQPIDGQPRLRIVG